MTYQKQCRPKENGKSLPKNPVTQNSISSESILPKQRQEKTRKDRSMKMERIHRQKKSTTKNAKVEGK